jgi:hypothetical protein
MTPSSVLPNVCGVAIGIADAGSVGVSEMTQPMDAIIRSRFILRISSF